MLFLYLDESGDLGFDFVNKKPSKFFTITILVVEGKNENRKLINAVKKTLARKLNPKGHRKRIVDELKGTGTTLAVKKYFFQQLSGMKIGIYSLSLNKAHVFDRLRKEKERTYNYLARKILDRIPLEKAHTRVYLIVDKSKGKREVSDFNQYIVGHLQSRLDPRVPLNILHEQSQKHLGIQAADLFSWGIFQKHERRKTDWYECFSSLVKLDEQFL